MCSESVRPAMGGIGVRYLEMARRLPALGFDTVLISPAAAGESQRVGLGGASSRQYTPGALPELLRDCDLVVAQGQLANEVVLARDEQVVVIDLYDPWLVENFHYRETLGLDPYRNDHASWVLQIANGDFFLCSSAEQRLFYLGWLTALGRVNPLSAANDPTLSRLLGIVPFGCAAELPEYRPLLPARRAGERRLLFGGVYDWYDTTTLVGALDRLGERPWTLLVVRNPNPDSTPQRRFAELEAAAVRRGWWGTRVEAIDWVAAERRYDLLAEVDLLVAPHRPAIESELSFRTRFLDAIVAGCPVVATRGGPIARLLEQHDAGWMVPPEDPNQLAEAIAAVLDGGAGVDDRVERARGLARELSWERALEPLVEFLERAEVEPTRREFAFRPATRSAPDATMFRLRRRLRRLFRGLMRARCRG